jgi:AcrR family transcriptional regulator
VNASDAPVREPGTRARSGNAMARTRAALLAATGECLGRYGVRKTTMVDVAERSRVAKATLYNHFRTKDDLLAAYVEDRVVGLVRTAATAATDGLPAALASVARQLADDPALRRAAAEEPAVLAVLAVPSAARGWLVARDGVRTVLAAARVEAGEREVELVLRWVTSQLHWPADEGSGLALVAALSVVPAPVVTPHVRGNTSPAGALGWPR